MPTYAYRCTKCEHEFEVVEKITARSRARKCPVCGGRAQRIITGGAGFLFKGGGFYVTDYRSEEYRSRAEAEKDPVKPAEEKAKPEGGESSGTAAKAGQKQTKKRKR